MLSLEATHLSPNRFYWAWIFATAGYGVGDTVTTVAIVWFVPWVAESNPVVAGGVATFGLAGLVAVKLGAMLACLAIAHHSALAGDRLLPYFLPVGLGLFGTLVTAWNLLLLFGLA
nr:hypothetical protein [Salinirubrum litoreum]